MTPFLPIRFFVSEYRLILDATDVMLFFMLSTEIRFQKFNLPKKTNRKLENICNAL